MIMNMALQKWIERYFEYVYCFSNAFEKKKEENWN